MFLRRALLRLVKSTVLISLTWIFLAILYVSLPSPIPDDASTNASLLNGRTITRVFDKDTFFPPWDINVRGANSRDWTGQSFIMQFRLIRELGAGSATLVLGGGDDDVAGIGAFFGFPPQIEVPYHNILLEHLEGNTSLSSPTELTLATGDVDHLEFPPAAPADAALLAWWVMRDVAQIFYRIRRVPEENLVQIWTDSDFWYQGLEGTPPGIDPLLSITLDELGNISETEFPSLPASSSPSMFYPIRLVLIGFLGPVGVAGFLLFALFSGVMQGIFALLALVLNMAALVVFCVAIYGIYWWIKHERPRMAVSVSELRDLLDSALDTIRSRNERAPEEQVVSQEVDLEANRIGARSDEDVLRVSKEHHEKEGGDPAAGARS
ncbi:hypothetical protein PM082_004774 [Marasmius tenuissimus]|nr:hypothetical protein PM082_004774 [Marasmius tenuissimus]